MTFHGGHCFPERYNTAHASLKLLHGPFDQATTIQMLFHVGMCGHIDLLLL
jgi:hypothetical protein